MHKGWAGASLEWLVTLIALPDVAVADVVKSLMKHQESVRKNTGWWLAFQFERLGKR